MASWVTARVVVVGALAFVHYLVRQVGRPLGALHVVGLLGWDAAYYRDIAATGYPAGRPESLRFFPLLPMLAKALSVLTLGHVGVAILVVTNVAALGYAVVLVRLVHQDGFAETASRVPWLVALAPSAFVLVMGYSEAVFGVLAAGTVLLLRRGRWVGAAVTAALAGLCRPVGLALLGATVVEAARAWPAASGRTRAALVAAALGPVVGTCAYLGYVWAVDGDPLLPFRVQQSSAHHGGLHNPLSTATAAVTGLTHGHIGTALHVPWVLVFLALLVVAARRLPASYTAFAVLTLLAALTGSNLDSVERYGASAFPLLVAAAMVTARTWLFRSTVTVLAAALSSYTALALLGYFVP